MRIAIEVPEFDGSLHMVWEPHSEIEALVENGSSRGGRPQIHIRANRPGLISLARLMLTLADDAVVDSAHWHLDPPPVGDLVPGSASLIIGRENSPTRLGTDN